MAVTQLLAELERRGAAVGYVAADLTITPSSALTDTLRGEMRRLKPDILAHLQSRRDKQRCGRMPMRISEFGREFQVYPTVQEHNGLWWWRVIWRPGFEHGLATARARGFNCAFAEVVGSTILFLCLVD